MGLFFDDKAKSLFLAMIIGRIFVSLLLKIIHWGGEWFYIYIWVFIFLFLVFMVTAVTVLVRSLFNKYNTMKNNGIKDRIYGLKCSPVSKGRGCFHS